MKVLYVFDFHFTDYMADCIYHGLIDSGLDVYESHYPGYMMSDYESKTGAKLSNLYGKGFSVYAKLNHIPKVEPYEKIVEKIKEKFYDIVIYGCVYDHSWVYNRCCLDYLEEVIKYYPRTKVHFVDGADEPTKFAQKRNLDQYGIVWKRELTDYSWGNPISFAIPESQLRKSFPSKIQKFSPKISRPNHNEGSDRSKYTFDKESEYYDEYAKSYYGYTCKKAGWDCMRHYEILANKTIPYFEFLENCPPTILTNFPKNIILEINNHSRKFEIHSEYDDFNNYLFEYTKKNLTTKKMVEKFLV